jgi:adenine-specific DNA-methyltransferase
VSESPERISISTESPSESILEALSYLIPGAIQDGVIDVQRLAELSGLEVSGVKNGSERFGLMWAGKSKAVEALQAPSMAALVPDVENSINWDTAENVFIEGDNLEVLKLLQKAYNDQVKLIYIDPPYNTGNDFVYNDDFSEPLKHYLEVTGQVDSEGNRLVANTEISGRKHSNWLSMMYPRLVLARNMLRDDGMVVISIDDCEQHNLRSICDEVFGEQNFAGVIVWKKKTNGNNMGFIPAVHEYLLCYGRNLGEQSILGIPFAAEYIQSQYSNPDSDDRGAWTTSDLSANHEGPYFGITNPSTGDVHFPSKGRFWVFNEVEVAKRIADGRIIFGKSGNAKPVQKKFLSERSSMRRRVESLWDRHGMNSDGTAEITALLGPKIFSHAKPTSLISHLLEAMTESDDIVVDFFAGSGTTGHAVLLQNAKDAGSRRFVLVNLPELTPVNSPARESGFETISEIARTRLLKVMRELPESKMNSGLRCLRLSRSSFIQVPSDGEKSESLLFAETLQPDSTDTQVAAEIFLKHGVRLDEEWMKVSMANGQVLVSGGVAVVLARSLDNAICTQASELDGIHTVVFLEDAFAGRDAVKANAHFAFKQANKTMKTI